jgi:single-strand DNA-binding protein
MVNVFMGMGRICNDLELRHTGNGTPNVSFTLAIDREYAKDRERVTDFLKFVAWRHTAEFICKHFAKGSLIFVRAKATSREYEADGKKNFVTEFRVDEVSFTGERRDANAGAKTEATDEFVPLLDTDDDLPF